MRHSIDSESVNVLAEDSLFYIGEQRDYATKRVRLEKIVGGLQEASRIQRERLVHRVDDCREQLRQARTELEGFDEIDAQTAEVHAEILALAVEEERTYDDATRVIAQDASAAGFRYGRTELDLIEKGGVEKMLAERRRRHPQLSEPEVEAI